MTPPSNPDPFPLLAEWWWQCATHEGGDSRSLQAEGSPEPGRQPRQRQARQAEGRVHADSGPAAGKAGTMGLGPWPHSGPTTCSAMCSSCVLGVYCHCSYDYLPTGCPERSLQSGLLHQSLEASPPASPQSQCSASGLGFRFSARPLP